MSEPLKIAIFAHHRAAALTKLEKLARRAARYGQAISWTERPFTELVTRQRWDGKKVKVEVKRIELTIDGAAPRVGEYRFIAQLENAPGGVLVSAVKGVEVGQLGYDWTGSCDHCGSNRYRRQAFVVESPDGDRKVVGKSCLRDYTGIDSPEKVVGMFALYDDLSGFGKDEEDGGWGGYGRWEESTIGVIAAARAAIALWGWKPSTHEGRTTAMDVNLVYGRIERDSNGREFNKEERDALKAELSERGDHYQAVADQVLDWGRNLQPRGDYEHNLKVALAGDLVIGKTYGLVVSACAAFDRQAVREDEAKRKREAEEARTAALPKSFHLGTAGDRVTATVTIERKIGLPDYGFGPQVLIAMRADDGPVLSWKTSSVPRVNGQPVEVGDRFEASFTVKGHAEFKGTPETRVIRVKFEALQEQAA